MNENELSNIILGCALYVHSKLGPGLLESAYEECLSYKLIQKGLSIEKQKPMPLIFEGVRMECGFRADIIVEKKIIIEIKSIEALGDIHTAQILTYLKITDIKLGLLINFNVPKLKLGIKRCVNNL